MGAKNLREEMNGVSLAQEQDVPLPEHDLARREDVVHTEEGSELGVYHHMVIARAQVLLGHPVTRPNDQADRRELIQRDGVLDDVRVHRPAGIHNSAPFVGEDDGDGENYAGPLLHQRGAADLLPPEQLLQQEVGLLQGRPVVGLEGGRGPNTAPERHPIAVSDDGEDFRIRLEDVSPKGEVFR